MATADREVDCLTTIRVEISRQSVVVRVPAKAFSMTLPNELTLRDRSIVAIGGDRLGEAEGASQPDLVTKPGFDGANFDADVARAYLWWAQSQALKGAHIGWRHQFAPPVFDIDWPAWGSIPAEQRRSFLEGHRRFRVTINGRPAVRPRVDVPLLRGLFGTRIDPEP